MLVVSCLRRASVTSPLCLRLPSSACFLFYFDSLASHVLCVQFASSCPVIMLIRPSCVARVFPFPSSPSCVFMWSFYVWSSATFMLRFRIFMYPCQVFMLGPFKSCFLCLCTCVLLLVPHGQLTVTIGVNVSVNGSLSVWVSPTTAPCLSPLQQLRLTTATLNWINRRKEMDGRTKWRKHASVLKTEDQCCLLFYF